MSKKILQIYEIGQEMPEEDQSVTIDLTRHPFKSKIEEEIPHGLTKVQEETWRLQNKKK
tara:strand:+ start:1386 stop:1562 length:177 start_codon:yes stop_codon:yes gene_type:complete